MAFSNPNQATLAFKHLLGKSNTDVSKEVGNEAEGIFFNVHAQSIWMDPIDPVPATTVANGYAVQVTADMVLDNTSNGHALFAAWPATPPSGNDPVTAAPFAYGAGTLVGIAAGDRVRNAIPPSYGVGYEAKPFDGTNQIPVGDPRDWIYQYNSGIFFQQDVWGGSSYGDPDTIQVYVFIGNTLAATDPSATINVTATGTDTYIGSATPTILAYDLNAIYLVTFANNNTGASTLDIDGIGPLAIMKGDETFGLVALDPNDIVASVVYYVVYDGTQFQLFTSNPTSLPGTYTNLNPTTVAVGGVPVGSTFNNTTYTQIFNTMFYPYIVPQFTGFSISGQSASLEVGATISAGTKTFLWSATNPGGISPNTVKIKDLTLATTLASGLANDGTENISIGAITKTTNTSHSWRVEATRTNSSTMTRNFTVTWYWRFFYGTSTNTSLTAVQAQALSGQYLGSSHAATMAFASGGYKYYVMPHSGFGFPSLFKDTMTQLAVAMADPADGYTFTNGNGLYYDLVTITNAFSVVKQYRVYRTKNILGGAVTIAAS